MSIHRPKAAPGPRGNPPNQGSGGKRDPIVVHVNLQLGPTPSAPGSRLKGDKPKGKR